MRERDKRERGKKGRFGEGIRKEDKETKEWHRRDEREEWRDGVALGWTEWRRKG